MSANKLKRLIQLVVEQQLSEFGVINEAFSSPLLSDLWSKIKANKWDREHQKDLFRVLRKKTHLGPVAWDKIPSDAVTKVTPAEARGLKDAINIWVTNSNKASQDGKGYNTTTLPVLAVTRGRKALWQAGGEKRSDGVGFRDSPDRRMGGMGAGDVSFKSIESLVDYVISIDIFKAKATDTTDLRANRAEMQKGMLVTDKRYKQALTKYVDAESSSTGKSYTFVKDATKYIAKLNQQRYKNIIADRQSKGGTEEADRMIKGMMALSNKITSKIVDDKPEKYGNKPDSNRDFELGIPDGRYGIDARGVVNLLSSGFSAYEGFIRSYEIVQKAKDYEGSWYKNSLKDFNDDLKRRFKEMTALAKQAGVL